MSPCRVRIKRQGILRRQLSACYYFASFLETNTRYCNAIRIILVIIIMNICRCFRILLLHWNRRYSGVVKWTDLSLHRHPGRTFARNRNRLLSCPDRKVSPRSTVHVPLHQRDGALVLGCHCMGPNDEKSGCRQCFDHCGHNTLGGSTGTNRNSLWMKVL